MKIVGDKLRAAIKSVKDFCILRILHADDPPHRLALGIAIGMFVTFTPLIGFQMLISVFLAWLLRANKLVGVPLVWISNPVTFVPIYYPCYWLGCKVLGQPVLSNKWEEIGDSWAALAADPTARWLDKVKFWGGNLMDVIEPLWVGCLIVATVLGVVSYYISLISIRAYRMRRFGQLMPPGKTPTESIVDCQVTDTEATTTVSEQTVKREANKQAQEPAATVD